MRGSGILFPYLPHQPGYHKRLKAAGRGAGLPGPRVPVVARSGAADRRDPVPCGTSRETARRSELAGWAGRMGWLRVLPVAFALVLGPEAVPAHHAGRDASRLVPGQPEDRRTRGRRGAARARRADRGAAAGPDPDRGQGLRRAGFRAPGHHGVRHEPRAPRPPRRGTPPRLDRVHPPVDRIVNDTLKGQLDLERHGDRTSAGLYARITPRLPAMGAAIWHNC